jgi:hypothetical protein
MNTSARISPSRITTLSTRVTGNGRLRRGIRASKASGWWSVWGV